MKHIKQGLVLLLLLGEVLLVTVSVGAEDTATSIPVYENAAAEIRSYNSSEEYLAGMVLASNNTYAALYFDPLSGNIGLLDKQNNRCWFSAPWNLGNADISQDQKELASSPVILSYVDAQLQEHELSSYKDCAAYGQISPEVLPNGVRFTMTVGKLSQSEVVPEVMPGDRLPLLEASLDEADYEYIVQSYRHIRAENAKETEVSLYPGLSAGDVYVLRSNTPAQVKKKLANLFSKCGYHRSELRADEVAVFGEERSSEEETANFTLILECLLEDGDLVVRVPVESITYDTRKYRLTDLTVLKYFGAADSGDNGFFLLPDGSGAISRFSSGETGSGAPFEVNLYGQDTIFQYNASLHSTQNARAAVFGQETDGAGYIAIAEEGDAQMSVRSVIDESENGLRYAHFVCHVRFSDQYVQSEFASYNAYVRTTRDAYAGDYKVRYRLLKPAGYSDMAVAYRQYLLALGRLKENSISDSISVTVNLLGAVESEYSGLFSNTRLYPLTTYAQSGEIAQELSAQELDNLRIRLTGWANGGMDYTAFNHVDYLSQLGGVKEFQLMVKTIDEAGVSLYPEFDIGTVRKNTWLDGFSLSKNAARQLDNTYARRYPYNMGSSLGDYTKPYYTVNSRSMVAYITSLLRDYSKNRTGMYLSEIGDTLNSDSRKGAGSRSDSMKDYIGIARLAAESHALMVSGGNAYTWSYASEIQLLPSSSSQYRNTSQSVPFLQIVLHGYIPYTGDSINLASDPQSALLKAVENGEGLLYTLAAQNVRVLSLSDHPEYTSVDYGYWKGKIIKTVQEYDRVLKGTFDQPVVEHTYLTQQVAKVIYQNGTVVIVNYGTEAYAYGAHVIDGKSAASFDSEGEER